jgi:hypothetical protein
VSFESFLRGDAFITDLVLDTAATASHTSVRPSATAQRNIRLLVDERHCCRLSFTATRQAIREPPTRTLSLPTTPSRSNLTTPPPLSASWARTLGGDENIGSLADSILTLYELSRDGCRSQQSASNQPNRPAVLRAVGAASLPSAAHRAAAR